MLHSEGGAYRKIRIREKEDVGGHKCRCMKKAESCLAKQAMYPMNNEVSFQIGSYFELILFFCSHGGGASLYLPVDQACCGCAFFLAVRQFTSFCDGNHLASADSWSKVVIRPLDLNRAGCFYAFEISA